MSPEPPPAWFTEALATPCEVRCVDADGVSVAVRCWGEPGPGIVLIHGGAAHSRWWDHIAPLLAGDYRVVALDLSGHGDSGRRPVYSLSTWAAEVMAVVDPCGIEGKPVIVGHSMGGWVSLAVGSEHAERVGGVVMIDSPIRQRTPEEIAASQRSAFGPLRRYASRADAVGHFHTVPLQPHSLDYIVEHVAETSIVEREGFWTWKFDPTIFDRARPTPAILSEVRCRVAVFRAEAGLVTADIGAQMYELLGRVAPVIEIPLAGHHAMLDQPLPLVVGLRTILADWEHSTPRRALTSHA